ncbi:dTDP-4-dehydrorhamnose reductase [Salegentibacter mishustinae]|uniref:dTDP-4-dehydrorhamnose reductase n=1 Tax=Salegentibacter mishustinae TaxID=270918 RepID=A0A0Q9ZN48_9FLAO|nr:dTDP-4-dehydrorhamnose reductase [Salegentibacter mishustinae]KRG29912.1 dTDP-4-dehydrorhamnose reductase [Salegentibacter mishustinae]PNW20679.1 NAD(P)-dependent oxidoreductase [Salegentibacter mishustinae]PZX61691.1 dTDP-4-dehydrorhamnose reductase [Salegentibacter mishustinae]GGW98339.1 NAD(P)-dependent oxidoreductase [Salegentibacter mishustinae]
MKNVLVTGASGQLGACFKKISKNYTECNFVFKSSSEADITDKPKLEKLFSEIKFDWVINCAAYTNVEKAESEEEKAFKINATGAKNLAEVCNENRATLVHFSTDYVFDGKAEKPYIETDKTNPINIYGASKLKGEHLIAEVLKEHLIFRTSWLYSEFGHNFYKTILRKIEENAELNITTSQTGTPTNANDLAEFVLEIIASENKDFGLYHFSNLGEATWYDFAKTILECTGNSEDIVLNKSNNFKTIAARPEYSVLDKSKIEQQFSKPILNWKVSLEKLINA